MILTQNKYIVQNTSPENQTYHLWVATRWLCLLSHMVVSLKKNYHHQSGACRVVYVADQTQTQTQTRLSHPHHMLSLGLN